MSGDRDAEAGAFLGHAARDLARSLHGILLDRGSPRANTVTLARLLRVALAAEARSGAPASRLRRCRQRLGRACDEVLTPGIRQTVADLRLTTDLTLRECADLLRVPYRELPALWRQARESLFAAVRQMPDDPARDAGA